MSETVDVPGFSALVLAPAARRGRGRRGRGGRDAGTPGVRLWQ
ncbi:MAG TPA: hypothetical protein VMK84_18040 [Streptosporangiaceae bacterium]|nr:hypothetical protein [Streptosporangiaceae bacterium]